MHKKRRILSLILLICLFILVLPVYVSNASTAPVNLCWDSTGTDQSGIRWGSSYSTPNNWIVNQVLFNKSWESCITFKVGFTIDNSSTNPPLNMNYRLYAYDGTHWIQTDAVNYITSKNTEYIFEPAFVDGINITAFAIYPEPYRSSTYTWSFSIIPYTILSGYPDQVAFINDFDFNFSGDKTGYHGSNTSWYENYNYSRNFHFYDSYIFRIGNKYFLKGKYWATGGSRVAWWSSSGGFIYYMKLYQSSNVAVNINGVNLGDFSMSGTPADDSQMQSAVLRNYWYYPDGTSYLISLGTSKPTSLIYQAVHSGSGGQYIGPIAQTTTNYPVSLDINNKPTISSISQPLQAQVFSAADTSSSPVISVYDEDNQTLTCRYFIDSEPTARDSKTVSNTNTTQMVSFIGFNPGSLTDGTHVVRFEVNDGKVTSTKHVVIKVDKRAPAIIKVNITSTDSGITVTGTAKDTISDSNNLLYSYIFGQNNSGWMTSNTYTIGSLQPNTKYAVKFSVKDGKGNISESQYIYYTKAQLPSISLNNITSSTINLQVSDSNPASTKYQIKTGSLYVSTTGKLTSSPVWLTLTGKAITVSSLSSNTTYSFQVKARNDAGVETAYSTAVAGTTN